MDAAATKDPTIGVERQREPRRLPRGLQGGQVAAVLDVAPLVFPFWSILRKQPLAA
jgi:site-specific recombinase XerC